VVASSRVVAIRAGREIPTIVEVARGSRRDVHDRSAGGHPISERLRSFEVVDERYTHLDLRPGSKVLATHSHDGLEHPLVWARQVRGGRVVADTLGHGPESYDSTGHRALLGAAVGWLTDRRGP
jgi:type 1 glutamine amidotransferase